MSNRLRSSVNGVATNMTDANRSPMSHRSKWMPGKTKSTVVVAEPSLGDNARKIKVSGSKTFCEIVRNPSGSRVKTFFFSLAASRRLK